MSDTKFTPGPWYTSKPKGEHRVFVMEGAHRIATVAYGRGSRPADNNAALIAEAPQLFTELEGALSILERQILTVPVEARESKAFQAAEERLYRINNALARARGEKS